MPQIGTTHPLNADGPFYVREGCCLACAIPWDVAPEMFKFSESARTCYVYRQPENASDLSKMFEVLELQELGCIRCRSRDPRVLAELRARGLQDSCDFQQ